MPAIGDPGLIGHAVDWLLRLTLVPGPPDPMSAAGQGASRLMGVSGSDHSLNVFAEVMQRVAATVKRPGTIPEDAAWASLCRCCLLLGWYERAYRAPFAAEKIIAEVGGASRLDDWLDILVRPLDLEDLDQLGRTAVVDHVDLRGATPLFANPTFAMSGALGGADADLIAGGTLLDFKSTPSTSVVTNLDVWQVLGYALADQDDEYRIDAVGISAVRWRRRVVWNLAVLLSRLAGRPMTICEARAGFAAAADGSRSSPP